MTFDRPLDQTCLFLDVDGSLIDIAPRPEAVFVPSSLVQDLQRVNEALHGALALVSGRSIAHLDELFRPARLRASGVHGAEMRFEPNEPTATFGDAIPKAIWDDLAKLLTRYPGTFAENKRFSFAIHYRAASASASALHADAERLVGRYPDAALQLMSGHYVIEMKRASFDKGVAVRRFLDHPRFAGRKPYFVGDDVTDELGFAAVVDEGGEAYSVGAVIHGTTRTFVNPAEVRRWVATIAETESLQA